jgi:predicted DNA-binding antitoxin AbrB/MazE fold protein
MEGGGGTILPTEEPKMSRVEAVYQEGVFKPAGEVELPENQRVWLDFEPIKPMDLHAWLAESQRIHERFIQEHGYLPDSTPDIAADRLRDE